MTGSSLSLAKKNTKRVPGYLLHRATGQARVRISGKDYYLGPYGSIESRIEYGRLIAENASGVDVESLATFSELTINELVLAFLRHAHTHYVKNGTPTSEIHCLKLAVRPLVDLYGHLPVDQFGPLKLIAVRDKMIDLDWVRKSINKAVGRIRHIFRWGVSPPDDIQDVERLLVLDEQHAHGVIPLVIAAGQVPIADPAALGRDGRHDVKPVAFELFAPLGGGTLLQLAGCSAGAEIPFELHDHLVGK